MIRKMMIRKMRIGIVVALCVLLVAAFGAAVAMADVGARVAVADSTPAVPTLLDTLGMLAQGIGVGATIAFLFERVKWFQDMSPDAKWWTIFVLSLGLPVLARVALQLVPPDIWVAIEPYWISLATGFLVWVGSQAFHLYGKNAA